MTGDGCFYWHSFAAFGGSRCEVLLVEADPRAIGMVQADVHAFDQMVSRFIADSELSRINASSGRWVAVSPLLEELCREAVEAWWRSRGLVNAACLPAVVAAGYDRTIDEVRRSPGRVTAGIGRLPALVDVLDIRPGEVRLQPGCGLDLGGIAKGWLADRLAERFDNVVVSLGGDLRARGGGRDGDGWRVLLCDGSSVRVTDAGVATSGTTARSWPGGHHLIDPRTGEPARGTHAMVSCVAATAADAEVDAKVALLDGPAAVEGGLVRSVERSGP